MNAQVAPICVEHHREPVGIGEPRPRLSWITEAPADWVQTRYELLLVRDGGSELCGPVDSPDSVLVPWPSVPLASRERVAVQVRVWGRDDDGPSGWSEPTLVEAGLLRPDDWVARAVAPVESEGRRQAWLLRSELEIDRPVLRARLYVTAHGLYEMEINGRRVGDHALAPGWTSYGTRLRYATHDVTGHLRQGANAVGAWLGEGWYRGRLGFLGGHIDVYGGDVALLAQLEVAFADGSATVLATGERWRAATGPIVRAGLLDGETYDARLERTGWSQPAYDDGDWEPVRTVERDPATLVAPQGPPVRCTQEVAPVAVSAARPGALILDFGQNLVGRVRITLPAQPGARVRLRHAEVLQDGELCTRPLRGALATDEYVGGDRPRTWEPRFTIHGFRYVEVTGWNGDDPLTDVAARVLHTDLEPTGMFECSDPMLNRLHDNVVWSMRGNFVDLPTDCPQRDERLGWTGDLQVFAPTATFLHDCAGMLSSWLADVAAEQLPDGTVPWYVPAIPGGPMWTPPRPGAGWGDAAVLVPWVLYERFGDVEVVRASYASARAWVECVHALAGADGVWDTGFQLGDWLDPTAPPDDPVAGLTDRHLVATAYHARSAGRLAQLAALLDLAEDAAHFAAVAQGARQGFRRRYVAGPGRLVNESQASYAIAIAFGLFDEDERLAAGSRLAELVTDAGMTLTTGFLGTPVLLDALGSTGQLDTAYALLVQRSCPSWLYPVTQGATTMWERWDSLLPDGSVNPGEMTSFNHYAFGAVADWMHRVVAGLEPLEPGYRRIRFAPRPGGSLTWAAASHRSPYGRTAVRWHLEEGRLYVRVEVPTGATGVVELPDGSVHEAAPGSSVYGCAVGGGAC